MHAAPHKMEKEANEPTDSFKYNWPVYSPDQVEGLTKQGICHYFGHNVVYDYTKAVECFTAAAKAKDDKAAYCFGVCLMKGYGVARNGNRAVYVWKSVDSNDYALFALGVCVFYSWCENSNTKDSIYLFMRAAEAGNALASFFLANCYKTGVCVSYNNNIAVQWLLLAAAYDYLPALNVLGSCYYKGSGVTANAQTGFYLYLYAAQNGYSLAQYNAALCYEMSIGTPQNFENAYYWYQKATEQGLKNAYTGLERCASKLYHPNSVYSESVGYAAPSQRYLGTGLNFYMPNRNYNALQDEWSKYQTGYTETAKDKATANLVYYEQAAYAGDSEAYLYLANAYFNGKGVAYDHKLAMAFYEKAVDYDNVEAMNCMANCCEYGKAEVKDYTRAFQLYKRAAELGHAKAQYNTGRCLLKGIGTYQDINYAVYWLQCAAAQKNKKAAEQLAKLTAEVPIAFPRYLTNAQPVFDSYDYNRRVFYPFFDYFEHAKFNVVKDYETSLYDNQQLDIHVCMQNAEVGDMWAYYYLANKYFNGFGTEKNYNMAFYWYQQAADQGHSMALNYIGFMHEHGLGTSVDLDKALDFYTQAEKAGNTTAKKNLARCLIKINQSYQKTYSDGFEPSNAAQPNSWIY